MRAILNQFTCHRSPGGLCWWPVGSGSLTLRAQEILRSLDAPAGTDVEPLKQFTRRSVLRVRKVFPPGESVIVKGFPLKKIESRFKYRKYGLTEFINYQRATERKIPAPACYGYFEVRWLGMVTANGVVVEDLAGWTSLAELAEGDASRQIDVLSAAIPLLKILYETGTNHIDASPQNMLQSPDGGAVRLIDWQYCSFLNPRNDTQLALQAAHFLNYAKLAADSAMGKEWLGRLVSTCLPATPVERFRSIVERLQSRGKISSEDRLGLRLGSFSAGALQHA
jgi:serine/threonine protein kinase